MSHGVFSEEKAWQMSQEKFVERLLSAYPLYNDLIMPTAAAIYQVKFKCHLN